MTNGSDSWKRFMAGLPHGSGLSSLELEAWRPRRCTEAQDRLELRCIGPEALQRRLDANREWLSLAAPHVAWLSAAMSAIPHVVFVTDRDGIVLHSAGNDSARMSTFGLFPGYDWSEGGVGPNGAGTALLRNRPVVVAGPEHCNSALEDCTCTGAPVRASDGSMIGAIAINTSVVDGTPERLLLLAHTAHVIEQELLHFKQRRGYKLQGLQHTTIRALSESATLQEGLARVLETIGRALDMKWAAVWQVNRQSQRLAVTEIWHDDRDAYAELDRHSRAVAPQAGEHLVGRAWSVSGAAWTSSLALDYPRERAAAAIEAGLCGAFTFPIRNGILVLGVMEFFDSAPIAPEAELITTLDTLGSQMGLFIQRREAESALKESEQRYSTLAEMVPGMLFSTDAAGHCDYVSPRWYEYTGVDMTGSPESGWFSVVHPEDRPRLEQLWRIAVRSGTPFAAEYRLRARDGSYKWFMSRASARRRAGEIVRWYGTALDIDQQKRAEEALTQADRRKDQFLGALAHELRNPLAPICNALQILREKPSDAALVEKARDIAERQIEHMAHLIEELLDVSRLARGRIRLSIESLDFGAVVTRAAESLSDRYAARDQSLHYSPPAEPLFIRGDAGRLHQVVTNLLENASKFSPAGARVHATVTREENVVQLCVRDEGCGIAEEALSHIFDLYHDGPPDAEAARVGLGLGLTLVKGLVEMHGGSVSVASQGPGTGAVLNVRLPLELEPVRDGPASEDSRLHGLRVLIIEPEQLVGEATATLLFSWGCDVRVTTSIVHAERVIHEFAPDAVLLNSSGDGAGEAALERLRASPGLSQAAMIIVPWDAGAFELAEGESFHHVARSRDSADLMRLLLNVRRRR